MGANAHRKLGLLPPPLRGRGGEGGSACGNAGASIARLPPPTPPRKGEGEHTEHATRLCLKLGDAPPRHLGLARAAISVRSLSPSELGLARVRHFRVAEVG